MKSVLLWQPCIYKLVFRKLRSLPCSQEVENVCLSLSPPPTTHTHTCMSFAQLTKMKVEVRIGLGLRQKAEKSVHILTRVFFRYKTKG